MLLLMLEATLLLSEGALSNVAARVGNSIVLVLRSLYLVLLLTLEASLLLSRGALSSVATHVESNITSVWRS